MLLILKNKEDSVHKSKFDTIYRDFNDVKAHNDSGNELLRIGLYVDKYQLNSQENSANTQASISSDANTLQRFSVAGLAGQLFPALIDTWNEAISDTKSNKRKKDTAPSNYFLVPNESVPILISESSSIIFRIYLV